MRETVHRPAESKSQSSAAELAPGSLHARPMIATSNPSKLAGAGRPLCCFLIILPDS
jgi:hypothetical protein